MACGGSILTHTSTLLVFLYHSYKICRVKLGFLQVLPWGSYESVLFSCIVDIAKIFTFPVYIYRFGLFIYIMRSMQKNLGEFKMVLLRNEWVQAKKDVIFCASCVAFNHSYRFTFGNIFFLTQTQPYSVSVFCKYSVKRTYMCVNYMSLCVGYLLNNKKAI